VLGIGILLLVGLGVAWGGCVAYTAWILTHPPRRTYASAVSRGRPGDPSELDGPREFRAWTLEIRGLRLPVWTIEGDLPAGGPTIVLTHGWADSKIGALARIAALSPVASRLIAWDLRGHGEATGTCGLGLRETGDLLALLEQLDEDGPVILYGWSLGAGTSIAAALERPVAAVIAESPYRLAATPARNVLRARGLPWRATLPPALLAAGAASGDPFYRCFDRASLAARLRRPLLVIHGSEDVICPIEDGRAIAAAAPAGRLVEIPEAGHNDLWTDERFAAACAAAVQAAVTQAVLPTPRLKA
jgi:pimeloyl-ACP methyl ester carboxylesterase